MKPHLRVRQNLYALLIGQSFKVVPADKAWELMFRKYFNERWFLWDLRLFSHAVYHGQPPDEIVRVQVHSAAYYHAATQKYVPGVYIEGSWVPLEWTGPMEELVPLT
jgi:hypothetical protein